MLAVFKFDDNEVRVFLINEEPWFVAQDLATSLGYADTRRMLDLVDSEDKQVINPQKLDLAKTAETFSSEVFRLSLLNESGVYSVIFGSTKPDAKRFKRWITSEVIPSIRKTGKYELPSVPKLPSNKLALEVSKDIVEIQRNLASSQPRLAQFLIEVAMNDCRSLMGTSIPALPSGEELVTVQAYAAEKGYPVNLSNRSSLGKFVAAQYRDSFSAEPIAQKQEVGGALRLVNVYPRNFLETVVENYFH